MDWFYIDANRETQGPYAPEKLVELFRAGVIGGDTLIWTNEMADWAPAKSCEEFFAAIRTLNMPTNVQPPPSPPRAVRTLAVDPEKRIHVPETVEDRNPLHPWRRFFARQLDIGLVAFAIGFFLTLALPKNLAVNKLLGNNIVIGMLTVLMLVPIEAILLAVFGTTFGKALYSIEVRSKNATPISFGTAFSRSFGAYLRGLGLGFPLISLFTIYFGYRTLKEKGTTSWDADNALEVTHRPIGYAKIAAIALVWLLYLGLAGLGAYTEMQQRSAALKRGSPATREPSGKQELPVKRESTSSDAEKVERFFIAEENRLRPNLPIKANDRLTLLGVSHVGNTMMYVLEIQLDPASDQKKFLDDLQKAVKESSCSKQDFREAMNAGANFSYVYFEKTPSAPGIARSQVAAIKIKAADCQ